MHPMKMNRSGRNEAGSGIFGAICWLLLCLAAFVGLFYLFTYETQWEREQEAAKEAAPAAYAAATAWEREHAVVHGARLRVLIDREKISRWALATALGLANGASDVQKIETGERPLTRAQLDEICRLYAVEAEWFTDETFALEAIHAGAGR